MIALREEIMDWTQTVTIIGTIIGTLGTFVFYVANRLDSDVNALSNRLDININSLSNKIDINNQRTDHLYQMFIDKTDAYNQRTDHLYQMFIDLLKEKK